MKKIIVTILALAILAMSLTACAERNNPDFHNVPTQTQGDFGPKGGTKGQQPRGQAPSGDKPANMPEKNGQAPTGDKSANVPGMNDNKPGENGSRMNAPVMIDFDAMVSKGIISQETCDKIKAYMEAHKPADLPEANGEKPADLPETNGEAPSEGEAPAMGGLLADLLKNGVISQAEYDAMVAAQ